MTDVQPLNPRGNGKKVAGLNAGQHRFNGVKGHLVLNNLTVFISAANAIKKLL